MKPFWKMTRMEFQEAIRQAYDALVETDWEKVAVGDLVTNRSYVWSVASIPPQRKFLKLARLGDESGHTTRWNRRSYGSGKLYNFPKELLALVNVQSHEQMLTRAAEKNCIPLPVQADYPWLFTPMPESWDEKKREALPDFFRRFNEFSFNKVVGWQLRDLEYDLAAAKAELQRLKAEHEAISTESLHDLRLKHEGGRQSMLGYNEGRIQGELQRIEFCNYLKTHYCRTLFAGTTEEAA